MSNEVIGQKTKRGCYIYLLPAPKPQKSARDAKKTGPLGRGLILWNGNQPSSAFLFALRVPPTGCPASVVSSVSDDSTGMGRYGPHYRRQPTQRRGPEVSTTISRTGISGRQNRPGPSFCPDISVVNPILSPFMSASCSSVVWAVSAHPRPISSNLRDSILTHF